MQSMTFRCYTPTYSRRWPLAVRVCHAVYLFEVKVHRMNFRLRRVPPQKLEEFGKGLAEFSEQRVSSDLSEFPHNTVQVDYRSPTPFRQGQFPLHEYSITARSYRTDGSCSKDKHEIRGCHDIIQVATRAKFISTNALTEV